MKKNRHAIIDPKTGLVRNIIMWDGAAWLPPHGHYVVHDCEGHIGDYWHQETNSFYTYESKKRIRDEQGKVCEVDLTPQEDSEIKPRLLQIYDHAAKVYNWPVQIKDLTKVENEVPSV
jgi:hypothetical protein